MMNRAVTRASAALLPEFGVLPQFKGPQPMLSLSHAFKLNFQTSGSNSCPGHGLLSELASQYLLIESGRIPAWDKNDALGNLKNRIQDLFEDTLKINDDERRFMNLCALHKFYVSRFCNDAFPYRIMQRHYLDSGQQKQAEEMERIAVSKTACKRSRFHAIAASIKHTDTAATSLAKYIPTLDQSSRHLYLIIDKADRARDAKTVLDAYCSVTDHLAMPTELFTKVLRNVRLMIPSTFSPPLLLPVKRVYSILSAHFDAVCNDSISPEMLQDMISIHCSLGVADALMKLFDRCQSSILKSEKSCATLASAFLRLNMHAALEKLQSFRSVKFSTSEHVKYATLLAEVASPEELAAKLGGLRLSAPIVSAALLAYCYTRAGRHDDRALVNAISAVRENYCQLARHRPSAIMYAAVCAERSLLPMDFAATCNEELNSLALRPAFVSNPKLRRTLTSIRAWTAACRGDRIQTEMIVSKAVAEQKEAPDSMRGAFIRASGIAAAVALHGLDGDLAKIESCLSDLNKLKIPPTASIFYGKVLAAAISGKEELFDIYFDNIQTQLLLETRSPHVIPTLVDLYDSNSFDDSELLKRMYTLDVLKSKIESKKFLVKLRQLPLFSML